jgi:hypothetical protein
MSEAAETFIRVLYIDSAEPNDAMPTPVDSATETVYLNFISQFTRFDNPDSRHSF